MAFTAEYIYRVVDRYSGPLNRISRATDRFRSKATSAANRVSRLSDRLGKMGNTMAGLQSAIGGAAITAGIYKFASVASTMEDAMADVERVTGLTGDGLARMQERLQQLGRETGRSAEGLAAIAYEGGKIGITNDKLEDFVRTVMKTAAAFDITDQEAGATISRIKSMLEMSVGEVDTLLQRVNYLADNTSASGDRMIEILMRASSTMKKLKLPSDVMAGWTAFADMMEVSPELAASRMQMMFRRMQKLPHLAAKIVTDPQKTIIDELKRLSKLPAVQRTLLIDKLYGEEAGRFVSAAIGNIALLTKTLEKAGAQEALGSMDREFENILKRSSTAAKRIKQTFIDISRAIGTVFLRVFDKYSARVQKMSEIVLKFVKTHPKLVKIVGVTSAILAAITAVVVPLGILFATISAGLPAISALVAAVSSIGLPVVVAVAGITALIAMLIGAYKNSSALRQAVRNLADAFSPLIDGIKITARIIGMSLMQSLGSSGAQFNTWGDMIAVAVNMVAAMVRALFDTLNALSIFVINVFAGNFKEAFNAIYELFEPLFQLLDTLFNKMDRFRSMTSMFAAVATGGASLAMDTNRNAPSTVTGMARDKAISRYQGSKVDISGHIGVSAAQGSKVDRADINLNTGSNLAVAH